MQKVRFLHKFLFPLEKRMKILFLLFMNELFVKKIILALDFFPNQYKHLLVIKEKMLHKPHSMLRMLWYCKKAEIQIFKVLKG